MSEPTQTLLSLTDIKLKLLDLYMAEEQLRESAAKVQDQMRHLKQIKAAVESSEKAANGASA